MEEKKIPLDRIDHTKQEINEAIGITRLELLESVQEISSKDNPETLIKKLGFSIEEILVALNNAQKVSKAIEVLWKSRGRKEISLREFIQTFILINTVKESPEMLALMGKKLLLYELVELVKSHGNQVLIDTPDCGRWTKTHRNCKGCPSEIGCKKINLITRCLDVKTKYQPKSFEDFLAMEKWIRERIDEILKATDINQLEGVFVP